MPAVRLSTSYVVFVDARVSDLETLIECVRPDQALYVLSNNRNDVTQIADVLITQGHDDASTLHLVAHRVHSRLQLCTSCLYAHPLTGHAANLARIGTAFAQGGHLLLRSYEVGSRILGLYILDAYSIYPSDIAVTASTRLVGSAEPGSYSDLDVSIGRRVAAGPIAAKILVAYSSTLGVNTAPSFGNGNGKVLTPVRSTNDIGSSVTVQPNGKILVAGYSTRNGDSTNVTYQMALVRYNVDGSLDASFDRGNNAASPVEKLDVYERMITAEPDDETFSASQK
ncbi:DUF4347 domain-containing protein [Methylobacterium sp. WL9]|uniref:DUF4347 domain-containing protein n=1 Tax=Methylobacterium sp. WL9 TaxID=2603898 RepID=UPI001650D48C|nr:DUF4347 domain-containing protein [Methylobacterium sp. WL9]